MKTYKLLKDLPTFKAGKKFFLDGSNALWSLDGYDEDHEPISKVCAFSADTLKKFPNILKEWFEEIPERPKTVWDLEDGDDIWVINEGRIFEGVWGCADYSPERDAGDVFLIREDAEKELARRKAKVILERDTKGFRPNWQDATQAKWAVYYDHEYSKLFSLSDFDTQSDEIYFASKMEAKESMAKHRKEWLTVLGVEE